MLSNILIAIGFFFTGSLATLATMAYGLSKAEKKEEQKPEDVHYMLWRLKVG